MKYSKYIIISFLMAGPMSPAFSQEDPIKDFAEGSRERKYCLYPSTLRMINLEQNEDYEAMIADVEKLLIYQFNSNPTKMDGFDEMVDQYRTLNFEELVTLYGGDQNLTIYGSDEALFGIVGRDDYHLVFYMKGMIALNKILSLNESLEGNILVDMMTGSLENFNNND